MWLRHSQDGTVHVPFLSINRDKNGRLRATVRSSANAAWEALAKKQGDGIRRTANLHYINMFLCSMPTLTNIVSNTLSKQSTDNTLYAQRTCFIFK